MNFKNINKLIKLTTSFMVCSAMILSTGVPVLAESKAVTHAKDTAIVDDTVIIEGNIISEVVEEILTDEVISEVVEEPSVTEEVIVDDVVEEDVEPAIVIEDDEDIEDEDDPYEYYDYDGDDATDYSGKGVPYGKLGRGFKLSLDVKAKIMQYVNSLNGSFTSPYKRGGTSLAIQCCAYVNQVWRNVFDIDLYSIPLSNTSKYSKEGETAYEFFERVGIKTGDVIYTRYQKVKKTKKGKTVHDKKGNPIKVMGQHFVIVLDYDEEFVWYTDGYETRSGKFVISAKNKKVKFSESKYFRNETGSYTNIEDAYYARADRRGTLFRHYSIPTSVWKKTIGEEAELILSDAELRIEGLDDLEYEYDGERKRPDVRVYDGNELLIRGRDYAVKYENNVEAGDAVVWVRGVGKHKGTVSGNFIINPIEESTVSGSILERIIEPESLIVEESVSENAVIQ